MKKIKLVAFSLLTLTPLVALAQASPGICDALGGVSKIVCNINLVLGSILPVLVSLGVIYFVWGVVQYFIGDSEEAKTKGRDRIIYGIIGLAVIISVWGLVKIVTDTLVVGGGAPDVTNLAPQSANNGQACTDLSLSNNKLSDVLVYFTCIIGDVVIPAMFAFAVLLFIWGAIKFFIINSDEESKREQGKQFMIWGIIALTVMISVWGLVGLLQNTFGVSTGILPTVSP